VPHDPRGERWSHTLHHLEGGQLVVAATGISSCDMQSSGSSATLLLLDGDGTVLWRDEERTEYYERGGRRSSVLAHPRAMDLWGYGRIAVRVRARGRFHD
jgi:hypothetical protein